MIERARNVSNGSTALCVSAADNPISSAEKRQTVMYDHVVQRADGVRTSRRGASLYLPAPSGTAGRLSRRGRCEFPAVF